MLISQQLKISQIKAVTKTVESHNLQRVGGCCEPIVVFSEPIPSELKVRKIFQVGAFRECYVSAKGLMDS